MSLLDGGMQAIFGAMFGAVYLDGTLTKGLATDTGTGGFSVADTAYPVKAMAAAMSDQARAASGLPEPAVMISLLRAGLAVAVDLDDRLTIGGKTYRAVRVETDPAAVAFVVTAVPVSSS